MSLGKYSSNFPEKDCDGKECPVTIYRALVNYPLMIDSFGFQENSSSSVRSCAHAQMRGRVPLFVTPWPITLLAPLSMEFPGKDTRVGCNFLLQGFITFSY